MPSQFHVVDREIPIKGICYVICSGYDPSDFSNGLARLTDEAFRRGAARVCVCCRDNPAALPREGFFAGGRRFSPEDDFYLLYKDLPAVVQPALPLAVKPLRASNAALYRDLYNEAFFSVPGARTLDEAETDAMLADDARCCGFWMEGGLPLGVYALSYAEQIPEIAAIAISPEWQGRGYGRRALFTLEGILQKNGHSRAQLLTSAKNKAALALYRSAGYGGNVLHSAWYRADAK